MGPLCRSKIMVWRLRKVNEIILNYFNFLLSKPQYINLNGHSPEPYSLFHTIYWISPISKSIHPLIMPASHLRGAKKQSATETLFWAWGDVYRIRLKRLCSSFWSFFKLYPLFVDHAKLNCAKLFTGIWG